MHTATAALVRIVALGVALAGYYVALPLLFPDDGARGANIGAGLIAFAGLAAISFVWALLDGRARGTSATVAIWSIIAAIMAIGWLVALAVADAGASMSVAERVSTNVFSVFFIAALILVPAATGAAIGGVLRPSPPVSQ